MRQGNTALTKLTRRGSKHMKFGTDKMPTVHCMDISLLLFFGVQRPTILVPIEAILVMCN